MPTYGLQAVAQPRISPFRGILRRNEAEPLPTAVFRGSDILAPPARSKCRAGEGIEVRGDVSGMGACLAELFPSAVRGSGQGFSYSVGRGIGGFCPSLIGLLSSRVSLGDAIAGFTIAAYALVIVSAWALPETRGRALGE